MKVQFSRHFVEKYSNIKFHENPFIGSRVVPCGGRTDSHTYMTKPIVALRTATQTEALEVRSLTFNSVCQ